MCLARRAKKVKIIFADVDNGGAGVGNGGDYYEHPVLKDATVVDPKSIPADKIPQGYELADTTPVEIIDNGNTLLAIVKGEKDGRYFDQCQSYLAAHQRYCC